MRVGHPARLLPAVVGVSLDAKLAASDGGAIVRDIKKEIDDAQAERRLVRGRGRGRGAGKVSVSVRVRVRVGARGVFLVVVVVGVRVMVWV